jgi:putative heme-binding domain-containing protein
VRALAGLASRDAADPWMRLAILSGLGETALPFLQEWISARPDLLESPAPAPEQALLLGEAAAIVGVRRRENELGSLLELAAAKGRGEPAAPPGLVGRLAVLSGLCEGLARSGPPLHDLLSPPTARMRVQAERIALYWPAARALALSDQPAPWRRIALEALVRGEPSSGGSVIPPLLRPDQPAVLQSAAVRAIARVGSTELAARVLDSWNGLALGTRRELLGVLASGPALADVLVRAVEQGKIAPAELDPATRDALLHLPEPSARKRAEAILARSAPADRSSVVARYQAALKFAGDAGRGAILFAKNCQTCHQHQGQGHRVGPDLSGIAGRPPSVLLNDILDPNRDVPPDFVVLTVATERGQVVSGLLADETGSSLKLRKAEGIEETILRSEIAEVRSSGRSLMPEGVEQTLNLQEMADLLAFLKEKTPGTK